MLQITPIPALSDNYIWLIQQNDQAIIVDPSEARPVLDYLAKHSLNLTACLLREFFLLSQKTAPHCFPSLTIPPSS